MERLGTIYGGWSIPIDISLNELKLDKYNLFTSDHAGIDIKLK
jgi:hypothetical protein